MKTLTYTVDETILDILQKTGPAAWTTSFSKFCIMTGTRCLPPWTRCRGTAGLCSAAIRKHRDTFCLFRYHSPRMPKAYASHPYRCDSVSDADTSATRLIRKAGKPNGWMRTSTWPNIGFIGASSPESRMRVRIVPVCWPAAITALLPTRRQRRPPHRHGNQAIS